MYDSIIIGAGPAGLMAGIASNKNTLIIEKNKVAGKKLLITGGGRCNITNKKTNKDFLDNIEINKKHLYSTINNFGPNDIINFFENNNLKLKEEEDNKIFPLTNKAYSILDVLLKNYKGTINYGEEVINIEKTNDYYCIKTNKNIYNATKIVIATGGSSFPITGSSGDNIKFGKMLNQPYVSLYPAETNVILKDKLDLAGTSIDEVKIKLNKTNKIGNLIFTHTGLSGSAIMQISEHIYKSNNKTITVDFLPNFSNEQLLYEINHFDKEKEVHTFLETFFTKKFVLFLLNEIHIEKNKKMKQLVKKEINDILKIKEFYFDIKSVGKLETAYVTGGGIDMKYINSKTMESTINKNLFFVGEALDIHGPIGGYNLTLALSTGYTAGINL